MSIDLQKIKGIADKFTRHVEIDTQLNKCIEEGTLNLSEIFFDYDINGGEIVRRLDEMEAKAELHGMSFKFKVKHSSHPGEFWIEGEDKERYSNPRTGQFERINSLVKSQMRRRFKASGNPEDHYRKITVKQLDKDGCFVVPYTLAKTCIIKYTKKFDERRPDLLMEVDLDYTSEQPKAKKDK
jgi:hypothetical protein